ncbi:Spo0E like sporulation regulatory protein [Clostridium pasteurianum DSM 525 = ATCC 6013]|uniref:Spo0E like sporulation regulatory protein n=1 Tax=Clostridium pasteurianum DSM 525 = ATCC 6013 TaxID=1262449 RepID=A0A0H3J231_CLOPA|nr:Spo0E family sporulation regulatory protein-aspartic acid phosphatase [Clostridium pasteurianum]AJA47484.1 Spo0E like sporulation regulatory protein [Clostridium pasteurianum DSM 525 = ATCC 6013]AJA51472.1 Spo0E like sporulation regulatory protein [Clostridium pasteurianum DSM 525 = ATCC 6013]KRU12521.1 Sporulation stage 0, Spo0E-like regulatory phosphatase [Clostridium pasteurianum DSM 525 = ATCC 6013]UZW15658.1 Spo0E family sporulation regulatory protein-aspartic acid phosphatase [Clostrid
MLKDKISILREKLHLLILEEADYEEILKLSQELDEIIVEFIYEKLEKTSSEE